MPSRTALGLAVAALLGAGVAWSAFQGPTVRAVDPRLQREYAGAYQWDGGGYVYLQLWSEFGTPQLGAFDESGEVRALHRTDHDRFFTGPGMALASSVESRVEFQRDAAGRTVSMTWQRDAHPARLARRAAIEKHEEVRFRNGDIELAGTLISPAGNGKWPAIVLVHGSGAADRDTILPFARFLVRHGIALLGYDKRGVGGSTGDWNTASFEDLAGDAVAAFAYLKTRNDLDAAQIGLLGVSQAGWVMPLAAVRAKDMAFLISVSGAGVPGTETVVEHARREMTASGMRPEDVAQIVSIMELQIRFARDGQGWDDYAAARAKLAAKMGEPPATFPATQNDPYWQFMKRLYFYDPAPTLRQLQVPTLAIFGELDNNIVADRNLPAWEAALKAGGHRDYVLRVLPRANHIQLEARVGNNAEMASLRRFVPEYSATVHEWLAKRVRGFGRAR